MGIMGNNKNLIKAIEIIVNILYNRWANYKIYIILSRCFF